MAVSDLHHLAARCELGQWLGRLAGATVGAGLLGVGVPEPPMPTEYIVGMNVPHQDGT